MSQDQLQIVCQKCQCIIKYKIDVRIVLPVANGLEIRRWTLDCLVCPAIHSIGRET